MVRKVDRLLLFAMFFLCCIGLVFVFSSSTIISQRNYGDSYYFFFRQAAWFIIGFSLLLISTKIPLDKVQKLSTTFLFLCLLLLVLVFFIGTGVKGATRWISLGVLNLQPSTISQLGLIIYISDYLARRDKELKDARRLYTLLVIVFFFAVLVLFQPDFSTSFLLLLIAFVLIYLSPVLLKTLGKLIAFLFLFIPIFLVIEPYRISRLTHWYSQSLSELKNGSWQSYQSTLSLGLGGFWGAGTGESRQKLLFLPEAHTDYILAIIAEEVGFLGLFTLLSFWLLLLYRGFFIVKHVREFNLFYYYLASGIVTYLGCYGFINIFVVTGLFPPTGVPFPFISYGGTHLVTEMVAIGLLLNISKYIKG